jgi:hypothetical protein
LVNNIGFDGSGTHCDASNAWHVDTSATPIRFSENPLQPCREALNAFKRFNRRTIDYSLTDRIMSKIGRVVRSKMQAIASP